MRRMPKVLPELDFSEDGYDGFHAKSWLNAPMRIGERYSKAVEAGDEAEAREAFLDLFPEWDFVDTEGADIPHTGDGVNELPAELVERMWIRRLAALKERTMPDPLGRPSSAAPSDNGKDSLAPLTSSISPTP